MVVDGKLQRQELRLRHLHVHLGSVQHKVSKLKSGRRFSLIIQYEWISTAGMETAAAAGVQARNGAFQPRLGQGEGGGKVQIATYDTMGEAEASLAYAREHGVNEAREKFPGRSRLVKWSTADVKKLLKYAAKHRSSARKGGMDWSKWSHPRLTTLAARKKLPRLR